MAFLAAASLFSGGSSLLVVSSRVVANVTELVFEAQGGSGGRRMKSSRGKVARSVLEMICSAWFRQLPFLVLRTVVIVAASFRGLLEGRRRDWWYEKMLCATEGEWDS